ncbi:MAG: hypothetical protein MUE95_13280 [Cyclobacteriaceae bacterium]|jgi:hypothetical protein|nr:hypothetical protein [Cyclobacteriaceae bacterium]
MKPIITQRRHYLTRVPLALLGIVTAGLSPVLIGIAGAWITEQQTGQPCHEGNCGWMVLPWLGMLTLPLAGMALLLFGFIVLRDTITLFNDKSFVNKDSSADSREADHR